MPVSLVISSSFISICALKEETHISLQDIMFRVAGPSGISVILHDHDSTLISLKPQIHWLKKILFLPQSLVYKNSNDLT